MLRDEILVWPDGSWCYRKQFGDNLMRGSAYRVVLRDSEEWVKLSKPVIPNSVRIKPI
jgi:hypothetical protein